MAGDGRRTAPKSARRRRRDPLWARLVVVFGALLMMGSGGILAAGKLLIAHYSSGVTRSGGLGAAAATDGQGGTSIKGAINLLLLGVDERTTNPDNGNRADSIIIAHIPPTHDAVYLVSVPRDTRVDIPAFKATRYAGGTDKINAAFQYGYQNGGGRDKGLELVATTIQRLTGGALTFQGAAIVNFDGFKDLVKAIGGVNMCVDEKVTSIHVGWNTKTGKEGVPYVQHPNGTLTLKPNMRPQVFEVGCRPFSAEQALDYVRQRDLLANGDSDYGRQRHQQQFIKAMLSKTMSSGVISNPIKINAVLNSVGKAVTFYNQGIDIADWVFTLKDVRPENMAMIKTNAGKFNPVTIDGVAYETLSPDSLQLLKSLADDTVTGFILTHPDWVSRDS